MRGCAAFALAGVLGDLEPALARAELALEPAAVPQLAPPDPRFRPGRDVRGRPVVPADLPDAQGGLWLERVIVPLRPPGGPVPLIELEIGPGPRAR